MPAFLPIHVAWWHLAHPLSRFRSLSRPLFWCGRKKKGASATNDLDQGSSGSVAACCVVCVLPWHPSLSPPPPAASRGRAEKRGGAAECGPKGFFLFGSSSGAFQLRAPAWQREGGVKGVSPMTSFSFPAAGDGAAVHSHPCSSHRRTPRVLPIAFLYFGASRCSMIAPLPIFVCSFL